MTLLATAQSGDDDAFAALVHPHRRELNAYCYRMLGSLDDAEDAVQETLLAAWRGLGDFQSRSSLRTWLYRIASRVCLRIGSRRAPRLLSWEHLPPSNPRDELGTPVTEPVFLDPWLVERDDPAAAYERRESVELAFVAALQHLPANQRAVLILRDVLQFSAVETADLLGTSVASVTSAVQRARVSLAARLPASEERREPDPEERRLVEAFAAAFDSGNVSALIELLSADVQFTMPPLAAWFDGRDDVAVFLSERVFATPWRLLPVGVISGRPAFAGYQRQGAALRLAAVQVLHVRDGRIRWIASFLDPGVLRRLSVPEELPLDR